MPDTPPPAPAPQPPRLEIEDQLDIIIDHLKKFDKRDKMRTWGSLVKSLVLMFSFIGVSLWLYWNIDDIMSMMADKAAESVTNITGSAFGGSAGSIDLDLMKQFEAVLPNLQQE